MSQQVKFNTLLNQCKSVCQIVCSRSGKQAALFSDIIAFTARVLRQEETLHEHDLDQLSELFRGLLADQAPKRGLQVVFNALLISA